MNNHIRKQGNALLSYMIDILYEFRYNVLSVSIAVLMRYFVKRGLPWLVFFGLFDFTKPGKGIDANAPKKHPFFHFWELIWRKLSKLIILNMMYFVVISPILTVLYIQLVTSVQNVVGTDADVSTILAQILIGIAQSVPPAGRIILLIVSVVAYGPFTAGLTYMLRNYVREEHAWFSDFWERAKSNMKQGIIVGILDLGIYVLLFFNIMSMFSINDLSVNSGTAFGFNLAGIVSIFFLVLYSMMRNYIFTLMVTFDLSIMNIYKNSAIFAVVGLWRNLLVLVVNLATAALFILTYPLIEVIIMPLFAFSFWGFVTIFTCYPVIKKYMIDPIMAQQEELDLPGHYPPVNESEKTRRIMG